jgi:hypothetical protein
MGGRNSNGNDMHDCVLHVSKSPVVRSVERCRCWSNSKRFEFRPPTSYSLPDPPKPPGCDCQEKLDACLDWADAGKDNCFARSIAICGGACALRFVGQPAAIAKCVGACETAYIWGCTKDWRHKRSCCRKTKKICDTTGKWSPLKACWI